MLEINPLSVVSFAMIFSRSEGCPFTLFIVSFAVREPLRLIRSHLFIFVFFPLLQEVDHRGSWSFMSESVMPMFSSKNFMVSAL